MPQSILLNPGPVNLTERVRHALLREDLCHREPEFAELTLDIQQRLTAIYAKATTQYEAILLTGSGTCAVEAMLSTLIPAHGKALVITNGVYGERMARAIALHGKALDTVISPWHEPINLMEVETRLGQDASITHVVAVHHETTTGRLNDIARLGQLCQRFNVPLLLDCVSSFGAEAIEFAAWNVEACAATANKCLHGAPGLSFVLVKRSVFESRPSAANTLYLDLYSYQKAQVSGYSPFTQAVHISYALQAALMELEEAGGWSCRHQQYTQRAQYIRQGLAAVDVQLLLQEPEYSCVLTSFQQPAHIGYEQFHTALKQAGFIIYAGQGQFNQSIFRVANMGNIQLPDIEHFVDCCRAILQP